MTEALEIARQMAEALEKRRMSAASSTATSSQRTSK
jgi:hypothetical protein